ncbi:MAG: RNA 2',3'-cyclic phosphodiesterase [Pseudomonadota bacterium]
MAPGHSRVFFALWPDVVTRRALAAASRRVHERLGGKATRPDTLHLTLVFVGDVDDARLPDLHGAAARVQAPAFDLLLDRPDCWRHNQVAHLGPSRTPPALLNLVGELEAHLAAAGVAFDERPYRAHVTLVRKADCGRMTVGGGDGEMGNREMENPPTAPIPWAVGDFLLVKSSLRPEGARYEQLGRWPLL